MARLAEGQVDEGAQRWMQFVEVQGRFSQLETEVENQGERDRKRVGACLC